MRDIAPNSTVCFHGTDALGDTAWAAATLYSIRTQWPEFEIIFSSEHLTAAEIIPDDAARRVTGEHAKSLDPDIHINLFGVGDGAVYNGSRSLTIDPPRVDFFRNSTKHPFTSPHVQVTAQSHIVDALHAFVDATLPLAPIQPTGFLADFSELQPSWAHDRIDFSRLVVIGIGATTLAKTLSVDKWFDVAVSLREQGYDVCLVGASMYQQIIETHPQMQDAKNQIISLVGQLSIPELALLLSKAKVVAAGDTGIGHIAAGYGTPTVSVFPGMSNPDFAKPYGHHSRVVSTNVSLDTYCIPAQAVTDEIIRAATAY